MNLYSYFRDEIASSLAALAASGKLPGPVDTARLTVEPPRDASHGDVSTNAALVMAKDAGMKPRDFAALLAGELARRDDVAAADIAGPGFINLKLKPEFWHERLREVLKEGERYGASNVGQG
ncbi:MAG: arginine--tRNA ligase, partial [Alphaproteobacteria bacterium]|nr:arginine--tRNA ligase [Alphaproteobacteria bacterium]